MYRETQTPLAGGIPLYAIENKALHQFCLSLNIRAGAMFESEADNGIAHLFEHMVFRNLKHKYGGELYTKLLDRGLEFNAETYKEFVHFYIQGLPEGFPFAAEVLSGVFDAIDVPKEEFEAEKRRVRSEIRENAEKSTLRYFSMQRVWEGTSLARTNTGACGTVSKITQRQLDRFRQTVMAKDGLFFYLTGNAGEDAAETLGRALRGAAVAQTGPGFRNIAPVPSAFGRRPAAVHIKSGTYYGVRMAFDFTSRELPVGVRDVLYNILFQDDDAVLFDLLSEDLGLIYSYDSVMEQYDNIGTLVFSFQTAKCDLLRALRETVGVLNSVKDGRFSLARSLRELTTYALTGLDDVYDLNWDMSYENHILSGPAIDYGDPQFGRYGKIAEEDVTDAARRVFRTKNLTVCIQGDKRTIASLPVVETLRELDR